MSMDLKLKVLLNKNFFLKKNQDIYNIFKVLYSVHYFFFS